MEERNRSSVDNFSRAASAAGALHGAVKTGKAAANIARGAPVSGKRGI